MIVTVTRTMIFTSEMIVTTYTWPTTTRATSTAAVVGLHRRGSGPASSPRWSEETTFEATVV
jgi:hypothetical protein